MTSDKVLRVHVFQHVDFEGPGAIAAWALQQGHRLSYTRWYGPEPRLPELAAVDLLVVLGGSMSVHEEAQWPWLRAEKQLARAALAAGKPMLGICLGAQLLAEALGAAVTELPAPEIGFFPVQFSPESRQHPLLRHAPAELPSLHWHGETFALPTAALHAAASAACPNQAFVYGDRVVGLQFHPEMEADTLRELIRQEAAALPVLPSVQAAEIIGQQMPALAAGHSFIFGLLDALAAVARR